MVFTSSGQENPIDLGQLGIRLSLDNIPFCDVDAGNWLLRLIQPAPNKFLDGISVCAFNIGYRWGSDIALQNGQVEFFGHGVGERSSYKGLNKKGEPNSFDLLVRIIHYLIMELDDQYE